MAKDLLIGIDAGTSMLKAVAFDLKGRQLAVASMPNLYVNVGGGGVEQDMARTWRDTAATLRQLAGMVEDLPGRTAAVGVTGQGDGTWLVDEAGEPAGPAWLWLDGRAAGIVAGLREDGTGARTYALTGSGLNTCQQGAQLVWMSRHRPEVLARAVTGCHCKDWLYFKLTGQAGYRRLGGELHLRRLPRAGLRARDPGTPGHPGAGAPVAADRGRRAGEPRPHRRSRGRDWPARRHARRAGLCGRDLHRCRRRAL